MMFYFDNDYVDNVIIKNDSNRCDDIKNILIDKFKVKYKENKEGAQQKKIVDLGYVDFFDNKFFFYEWDNKFIIITNVYLFNGYMDTTYIDEASLRFPIHYARSKYKRNYLSIDVSYITFNVKGLKLISKIFMYMKRRKKNGWRVLIRNP